MLGPWDNSWSPSPGDFTYIAKDKNSNVYKIGKSRNLRKRILDIRRSPYFFNLEYKLIAFAPGNIESLVHETIIRSGGVPVMFNNNQRTRGQEMFRLEDDDIDVVIESFLFQRASDGVFPAGYRFSRHGTIEGYVGRYDITGWIEKPIENSQNNKHDGHD